MPAFPRVHHFPRSCRRWWTSQTRSCLCSLTRWRASRRRGECAFGIACAEKSRTRMCRKAWTRSKTDATCCKHCNRHAALSVQLGPFLPCSICPQQGCGGGQRASRRHPGGECAADAAGPAEGGAQCDGALHVCHLMVSKLQGRYRLSAAISQLHGALGRRWAVPPRHIRAGVGCQQAAALCSTRGCGTLELRFGCAVQCQPAAARLGARVQMWLVCHLY